MAVEGAFYQKRSPGRSGPRSSDHHIETKAAEGQANYQDRSPLWASIPAECAFLQQCVVVAPASRAADIKDSHHPPFPIIIEESHTRLSGIGLTHCEANPSKTVTLDGLVEQASRVRKTNPGYHEPSPVQRPSRQPSFPRLVAHQNGYHKGSPRTPTRCRLARAHFTTQQRTNCSHDPL